jgi:2'-5' RNA ligase
MRTPGASSELPMRQAPQASPDSTRLFLALLPDAAVQEALAVHRDQWQWSAAAACYAPADWHVTLHFIGSVARSRLEELRAALALPITPFALGWGRPELWPHGLAVLCPEVVPEALQQLHTQLGQALQQRGLRTDSRPFRPHFTLARHAQAARLPAQWPVFNWPVAGYALMESTGQAGQRYRVLQSYGPAV